MLTIEIQAYLTATAACYCSGQTLSGYIMTIHHTWEWSRACEPRASRIERVTTAEISDPHVCAGGWEPSRSNHHVYHNQKQGFAQ